MSLFAQWTKVLSLFSNCLTIEAYWLLKRSFGRRLIYHLKCLWEYIPKSILSVCTMIFKRIAGLCFYLKSLMLYTNGFVSRSSTNWWKAFLKFRIFDRKPKIFQTNSETWILIKLECVIYQWIRLDKLYKLMEIFLNFKFVFELLAGNWKFFKE